MNRFMVSPNFKQFYHDMLRIRKVEEALADQYPGEEMRCPLHLCIGQEAIAVGVSSALNQADVVFSNHRAHGHYLAKGGDLAAMIAEIFGRENGCCGGRGGSMHLIDKNVGFMGSTPIVGGTVPLAVGAAFKFFISAESNVSVIFLGDGCFEEGVVHKSLNFAALHKLPIIFVCENNNFSVYTPLSNRQPSRPIYSIALAHGMHAEEGDGNDVLAISDIMDKAVQRARVGEGPSFLEFRTYRWREHCGPSFDDHLQYRSNSEIEAGLARCPITRFEAECLRNIPNFKDIQKELSDKIQNEIMSAFEYSRSGKKPELNSAFGNIYA